MNLQVEQLRAFDQKKSETLQAMKGDILSRIKLERTDDPVTPEKEEKYSADLRLTEAELKSIFEEIKQNHKDLLVENGIHEFWEFK